MAIYIKGVDMPMEGFVLSLDIFPDGTVADHCTCTIKGAQAAAVPPHGDLMDKDSFLKRTPDHWDEENIEGDDEYVYRYYLDSTIRNAPVIVPAEREGET